MAAWFPWIVTVALSLIVLFLFDLVRMQSHISNQIEGFFGLVLQSREDVSIMRDLVRGVLNEQEKAVKLAQELPEERAHREELQRFAKTERIERSRTRA